MTAVALAKPIGGDVEPTRTERSTSRGSFRSRPSTRKFVELRRLAPRHHGSAPLRLSRASSGQALIETVLMIALFTVLLSAIIQVFLVHNYTFQMANNAYYSLFKDKAYGTYNKPTHRYRGLSELAPQAAPVRVPAQAGGRKGASEVGGGDVNWTGDDRAVIPMMPFFENAIVPELRNRDVTRGKSAAQAGKLRAGAQLPAAEGSLDGNGDRGGIRGVLRND